MKSFKQIFFFFWTQRITINFQSYLELFIFVHSDCTGAQSLSGEVLQIVPSIIFLFLLTINFDDYYYSIVHCSPHNTYGFYSDSFGELSLTIPGIHSFLNILTKNYFILINSYSFWIETLLICSVWILIDLILIFFCIHTAESFKWTDNSIRLINLGPHSQHTWSFTWPQCHLVLDQCLHYFRHLLLFYISDEDAASRLWGGWCWEYALLWNHPVPQSRSTSALS